MNMKMKKTSSGFGAQLKSLKKKIFSHGRKISLLVVNLFINHDLVFRFLGSLGIFKTVFVAYPAYEELALAYVYKRHRHWMRWRPWPAGIFRQNGRWGLMMVISSVEKDFLDSANIENMKALIQRTEDIRRLLKAEQKTFAGILPGIFAAKNLLKFSHEAIVTANAVIKAEKKINPLGFPVIVLGGKGFIGRRIVKKLTHKGRKVFCVDVDSDSSWPKHLLGQPAVVINVTKKAALKEYIPLFWEGLILLNEVYPAPSKEEIESMRSKKVPAFHVVGLMANSLPSFPREYAGGIPCCAGWDSPEMEVIIRELN